MGATEQAELTSTLLFIYFFPIVFFFNFCALYRLSLYFCLFVCLFVLPCFLYLYIYAYYFVCVFIIAIVHVCGPMPCAVLSSST